MNELMNTKLTMTSVEIAELVESRHTNIKRSIDRLIAKGVIRPAPLEHTNIINDLGVVTGVREYYVFEGEQGKRDSIIVVAQNCPEFTARLVDRWQELEKHVRQQPQLPASVEVKQLKHELTLANKQLKFEERRKKAEDKLREQVFKDLTRLTKENEELRKQINPLVNDLLQIAIKENERLRNLIKNAYEGL